MTFLLNLQCKPRGVAKYDMTSRGQSAFSLFRADILFRSFNRHKPKRYLQQYMRHSVVFASILILLSLAYMGCERREHYKIGISQCSDDDWRTKMNEEILREMMFHPEAEVEIRSANDNNAKQIADIKYFKDNKFDIIIAAPNEADALTPIISEVYDSGIPVVLFDRNVNGNKFTAWQGVDNISFGRAAARYAYNIVGEGCRVLEIEGLAHSTPAAERKSGFDREAEARGIRD